MSRRVVPFVLALVVVLALAGALLADDLVDEVCLTTSPSASGTSLPVFGTTDGPARPMRLLGMLSDERSALYARWSRAR